ncbi:ABC transporter substrate-binding protein [Alysiella filiformis]|uniref:Polar amino acid transport system substrate-binding protein n=1 Tax=Alysiella filiformis DSM 16848 TaxID=1120981 RepID=A0A286EEY5_9NEIS|nr:transporter substrate-binding domain-containing protein [Alysiella filiformis]QMT31830.1 amino acid ABC transporter substrate-binding protein [Alysiella filiformis]UBQ57266.1 transporter substrate-binding domain-containing protein [Alysiella filiformis DSM 16848]SOD69471.1 polar amino acid transport system substrate-binding protein [Alysiella filiformis DSM 16848]
MRKYLLPLIGSLLLLNACSEEPAAPAATNNQAASNTQSVSSSAAPANPTTRVKVVAAVYPPFVIRNKQGSAEGFDIDILNEIAKLEGFEMDIFPQSSWEGALESLDNASKDLVVAAVTLTPERAEKYLPTKSYVSSPNSIVVPKNSSITQEADLKGKVVGVGQRAAFLKEKEKDPNYANVKFQTFETPYLALRAALSKEVDAVVGQKLYLQHVLQNTPDAEQNVRFIDLNTNNPNKVMMSRKGNEELVNQINSGLDKIKQNGTYNRIYIKWFGNAPEK